jgi:hypothetical protein
LVRNVELIDLVHFGLNAAPLGLQSPEKFSLLHDLLVGLFQVVG